MDFVQSADPLIDTCTFFRANTYPNRCAIPVFLVNRSDGFDCTAGTTASIVLIRGLKCWIANVGDSSIVLCRDNKVK